MCNNINQATRRDKMWTINNEGERQDTKWERLD